MSTQHISAFKADAEKTVSHLQSEFGRLQTGRANASLVEHIMVDAYGQKMDIKSVASISIQDSRTIAIQPWDKSMMQPVEKAIQQSDIGVNPVNDGISIRINLPPMTEERRIQLKKLVHQLAEDARISIRQHRQRSLDSIKKEADEDMRNSGEKQLQKEVDAANDKIDDMRKKKEEEVMKV